MRLEYPPKNEKMYRKVFYVRWIDVAVNACVVSASAVILEESADVGAGSIYFDRLQSIKSYLCWNDANYFQMPRCTYSVN